MINKANIVATKAETAARSMAARKPYISAIIPPIVGRIPEPTSSPTPVGIPMASPASAKGTVSLGTSDK